MKPGHFQYLQVGETQDEERERKTGGVENHREDCELDPVAAPVVRLQGAGRVNVVVVEPGEEQCRQGESERVEPGVAHHDQRVLIAHLSRVAEREDHRYPSVDAESCHAQHGVGGQKGLQKAHHVANAIPERLLVPDNPYKSGRHVQNSDEYVAERQVHGKNTGHLSAYLGAVDET